MDFKALIPGRVRRVASYAKGFVPELFSERGTGGTSDPRYCYSVWLRHLTWAARAGLREVPEVVAELGPGDSLGVGLCALLSGARVYHALDVIPHADLGRNLATLEALIPLFVARTPIPGPAELPRCKPTLDRYDFPHDLLTPERLARALDPARLGALRAALRGEPSGEVSISYRVPWSDPAVIEPGTVDFLMSQAVMEYVPDLRGAYGAMRRWLRPGGMMSHQIDLSAHETSELWNGHWAISEALWWLKRGRKAMFIQRLPPSHHLAWVRFFGLEPVTCHLTRRPSAIARGEVARHLRHLSDLELETASIFLQALAPSGGEREGRAGLDGEVALGP